MTPHDWLNSENTVKRSKKPYAHFDLRTDIGKQKSYISNPHKVAAHGFYPFIHYQIKTIKFNKTKGPRVKTRIFVMQLTLTAVSTSITVLC